MIDDDDYDIPDSNYDAVVKIPSIEFSKITRELGCLCEYGIEYYVFS